jgi:hypothetical protein
MIERGTAHDKLVKTGSEGTGERWNPIKDITIDEGSIPLQIAATEKIIDSQLRTFTRLGADNKFHTLSEYPPKVEDC